jgi:hypothetical protein
MTTRPPRPNSKAPPAFAALTPLEVAVGLGLAVEEVAVPCEVVELPECPGVAVVTTVVALVEGTVGEPEAVRIVLSGVWVETGGISVGKDDEVPVVVAGGCETSVVVPVMPVELVPVLAEPVSVLVLPVTVSVTEPETEVVRVLVVVADEEWVAV